MTTSDAAVFLHREHGAYQAALLNSCRDRFTLSFYEMNECIVRPTDPERISEPPLFSITQIADPILVFINRPLEAVNYFFFSELLSLASEADCGVATGVSLTDGQANVHANNAAFESGRGQSLPFSENGPSLDDRFFAVKRQLLASIGGLSAISTRKMPQIATELCQQAKEHGLQTMMTTGAVATFRSEK